MPAPKSLLLLLSSIFFLEGGRHGGGGHHGGGHRGHAGHGGHHVGRGGHHGYGHRGYGRRGYGHRGYGRGGWYGGFGWAGLAWAWAWTAGAIGATRYQFVPSQEAITVVYNGYYPSWGYGAGDDSQLDELARQGRWDDVRALLLKLRQQTQRQLDQARAAKPQNGERINKLEDRLNKIQLHINGLTSRRG